MGRCSSSVVTSFRFIPGNRSFQAISTESGFNQKSFQWKAASPKQVVSVRFQGELTMFGSAITREFALAQAALEHGVYFLELGADRRAAAYFQFASEHLQRMSHHLLLDKIEQTHRQSQSFPSVDNN